MNTLEHIDLMTRGGSLALLALWSWLLIRDHRSATAARIAVMMNATIVCHIITTIPGNLGLGAADIVLELGSASVPPLFWLFTRTWFNDESHVDWFSWLIVVSPIPIVIVLTRHNAAQDSIFLISITLMRTSMFLFAFAGLWIAWRGRDGDLIETRRRFRLVMVWTVGAFVILTNCLEMLAYSNLIPGTTRHIIEAGILILCFAFCAAMFESREDGLFAPANPKPTAPLPLSDETSYNDYASLAQKLQSFVEANRIWRDEKMSISKLAGQLGEQEYRVRRAINGAMGHRNFASFLNGYRLTEVAEALADPDQREVPIITMALDAGFGSLGPFNRAFREAEGMTPSEFRARNSG
jgi:AraC-like DNA-binding protein